MSEVQQRSDTNPLALAPVHTFASLVNAATQSYRWTWDEAYKRSRPNALAMRRDAYLMSLFFERIMPTVMADWSIMPDDPKDTRQLEVAKRYECGIRKIPRFRRYLKSALEAVWFGRAGVQQQWGKRKVDGSDFMTVVRHVPVNGDKIQYSWDFDPRILIHASFADEIRKQGGNVVITDRNLALQLDSPYWRDRFLIHAHDVVDADFFDAEMAGMIHGVGLRHWIHWLWYLKSELLSWTMDFMERVGLGLIIFYYEEGNPQSRKDADAAANALGRNTRIVWPRSTSGSKTGPGVEVVQTETSGAAFIIELSRYFDEITARFMLGRAPEDPAARPLFGAGENAAKLAKSQTQTLVAWDCDNLAETLDQDLLGPMIRYNDPDLDFDLHWKFAIEQPDPLQKLEAAKILHEMGVPLKVDELRTWAGATKPDEEGEEETVTEPLSPADEKRFDSRNQPPNRDK